MKRYFQCYRKKKRQPEFIEGTPVEILSPLQSFMVTLPDEKEKLQVLDFEIVEQIHLLEAEYNKFFQDAKSSITKDDMVRGIHFMNRSRTVKERIDKLEKRHKEILDKLEYIILNDPNYAKYVQPRPKPRAVVKSILKTLPTPK